MALRATIYKAELSIADNDRGYYGSHAVTLARHPSETDERLMVRLLAYALWVQADERLVFTRGLSDTDEPDLWRLDLTGAVQEWVEIGLPDERRLLKASGRAEQVVVLPMGAAWTSGGPACGTGSPVPATCGFTPWMPTRPSPWPRWRIAA
jgi:uncharacterized protein YaeQ